MNPTHQVTSILGLVIQFNVHTLKATLDTKDVPVRLVGVDSKPDEERTLKAERVRELIRAFGLQKL